MNRAKDLSANIIDVIKEEQIKLGYMKEQIRLYYPLSSLNLMMEESLDCEAMKKHLEKYFAKRQEIFGEVEVSYKDERFCIHLSDDASEYVYKNTPHEGFLYDFIELVSKHDVTIDEILALFKKYSENVIFEEMKDSEFDYLIYFKDGTPDIYWYCINDEGHHFTYHRYTKEDFYNLGL
ncbi:MAG: DUF3877 family protein [Lachnospiraceae bacterium]|nr:DUF3877 family protein [Lachnospiraceae bacterium]